VTVRCLQDPLVPPALRSCVAVDADGMPRFWATVHDASELMLLAKNTRRTALTGIDAFYIHVEAVHGADVLDRLLVELNVDEITSALEGFRMRELNKAAVEQRVLGTRWNSAIRLPNL